MRTIAASLALGCTLLFLTSCKDEAVIAVKEASTGKIPEVYRARLDSMGGFTPFGRVIEGMDVVDSLYGGYGDMPSQGGKGPDSAKIESLGDTYLRESFPRLDRINKAAIIE